ncbi:hypothetical protein Taro_024460 [Colocasia esculenta]|uniref:Uncharacterized protein n=1 Tax=Colocasia esculenta TaxID=4460 RepID=A0A843VEK1_COLES|nr:hypothetical protein [Colocasia esculenta]
MGERRPDEESSPVSAQASPVKQKFKEEQRFEEDTSRKKSGSTRSIRPNVKSKYKEHVSVLGKRKRKGGRLHPATKSP